MTGTNSLLGIGRAAAHLFAQSGAKAVFICDLNTENLDKHKRELNSLYPSTDVHVQKVDVGEEANVESVVNLALEKYGRLDVFFANGGVSIGTDRILDANVNDFMQTMKTNALRYVSVVSVPLESLTGTKCLSCSEARCERHAPNIQ